MGRAEVVAALLEAIHTLLARDRMLLELDVLERCVCGRLAIYLDCLFPDHDVDVEYNRHNVDPKRLDFTEGCRQGEGLLVIPDLIVHRRMTDAHNLLVIEAKLHSNDEPRACDREKLKGFLEDYGYLYGVLVDLPVRDKAGEEPDLTWLGRDEEGRIGVLEGM